jgi:long-subunit acyl-CoA synthetase (AMP-forming)
LSIQPVPGTFTLWSCWPRIYERLQFIAAAKDPWLIENGFLTPTMKIKRRALEETYSPHLDTWYSAQKSVVWEEA